MKNKKKKNLLIDDDFIDIDLIIPTKEELDELLKHIDENRDFSIEDLITLRKIELIKMINSFKGEKL